MKKLLQVLLHPLFLAVIGLLALSAIIWWVGPLIAIGAVRPLESAGVRLAIIVVLFLLLAAKVAYGAWQRKRTNAALVQGMTGGPTASDREVATLNERFTQAMGVLQTTRKPSLFKRSQHLYELPWYIFIGAPGSGKTTALMNAGLNFPLAEKLGQASVKGVGGTRNCDWWFTDEAVLIDTAGRYTTQESDSKVDAAAWDGFLALLKKTRPRRPLNGVILTINIQDLLQQGTHERQEHSAKLRARLQELHDKLGLSVPVYVLVTKSDLIAGFNESFGELGKEERDQVWGFSLPYNPQAPGQDKDTPLGDFMGEFGALEQRLRDRLIDRMDAEREVLKRAAVFAFPQEFASLKTVLSDFLTQVFTGGGQFEQRPLLRGIYFTSGTQEGTPIDRVMGTLARAFGVERKVASLSGGKGKSFFLHRLLRDVIFAEQGLVGVNKQAERRRTVMRMVAMAGIGVLATALLVGWAVSYSRNKAYIAQIQARMPELRQAVDAIPPANTGDVTPLPAVLSLVRNAAQPAEFDIASPPLLNTLGLYQGDKLDAGAQQGFNHLLQHALMPRVAKRLEERLRGANKDNLEFAYEALKAYLMLYTPDKFDADTLKAWISIDWETNLANSLSPEQRAALNAHLDAALAQGAPLPTVPMDANLVASVRDMLVSYPLEYRVYSRLKRAHVDGDIPEFTVASAAGPNALQVFERTSGQPLTKGIPGLFTRDGYQKAFQKSVEKATLQLATEEGWILGTKTDPAKLRDIALTGELPTRVRRLYLQDYVKVWDAYLADVHLVKLGGLDRSIQVARVLSAVDSPLAAFLRAVARETTLVPAAPVAGSNPLSEAANKAEAARKELAALSGAQPAPAADAGAGPVERIVDDHFAEIRRQVTGQPAPIDETLKMFNEVYVQLSAVDAAQKSKSPPPPAGGADRIKAAAGQQPEPIKSMLETLSDAGASQSRVAERASLTGELKPITDFCARAIAGRYPFSASSQANVMPDDFGQFFGQGGLIDDFYQRKLINLVDTGTNPWSLKPLTDGSRPPAPPALAEFQRAARIKDVFFRNGGKAPSFRVDIRALELLDGAKELVLDIDGQVTKFTPGNTTPVTVNWPSQRVASQIKLASGGAGVTFDGPWALFRMFDRFDVQPSGQPERFTVVVNVDGKRAKLEVTSSSAFNPFRLREIQQFRCPGAF
ncbi:MAG: type VI secretion system membrane subunit TssM [Rubrivivax sp.]|nr:MAG: type VI secretion system membrane subunit TssM [Rubrivivax sp.]